MKNLWFGCTVFFYSSMAVAGIFQTNEATLDWLGRGFDSAKGFTKPACVTGQWIETGNSLGLLSYQGGHTVKDRIEEKFGKIKGSVNVVVFSGSVSVSVYTKVSENETSASSNIRLVYDAKDYTLENRSLTARARNILDTPTLIYETCGDEYIHNVNLGSEVFVTAKLHFRSRDSFERYKTKIKIRVLFIKKTKTITKEFKKYTENAVYSIRVNTRGGMTDRLQQIVNNHPSYCRTANLEECVNTSNLLFDYLFDDDGYVTDLTPDKLKVLSFTTANYKDSGHFELAPENTWLYDPGYRILEQKLMTKLMDNEKLKEHFSAFYAVEENETERQRLESKLILVNENIVWLNEAMTFCKNGPDVYSCRDQVDTTLSKLHHIIY